MDIEIQTIESRIYDIRGRKVMLDRDLAELYQIETKRLKEAVKRNIERFEGEDFMFELSLVEFNNLRSQFATSNSGGNRYAPFAFTEMGVAMLSSVLRSKVAIDVNRSIMRAFVAMRQYLTTTAVISAELTELRARLELLEYNENDNLAAVNDLSEDMRKEINNIYLAIAELSVKPAPAPRRMIGYKFDRE